VETSSAALIGVTMRSLRFLPVDCLNLGFAKPKTHKTGRSGQVAKPQVKVEALVELLMEPAGRAARRRAAEAIRATDC